MDVALELLQFFGLWRIFLIRHPVACAAKVIDLVTA